MNQRDKQILRKYLPSSVPDIFFTSIQAPDDHFQPPLWLAQTISMINGVPEPIPKRPPVRFSTNEQDMLHNAALLESFQFDLDKLIRHHQHTTLGYGKEFRSVQTLETIYRRHPNFRHAREFLTNGVRFHFKRELTEEERREDLKRAIKYGNHKSAESNIEEVLRLVSKDIQHGFAMPIPTAFLEKIPGVVAQPTGAAIQTSITETGDRIEKVRVTHDSSFNFSDAKRSINDRVDLQAYPELIYGYCLIRLFHFIVALRLAHPDKSILLAKFDYSDAYRRLHHHGTAALMQVLTFGPMALVMLRMAFGGSPNPSAWTTISEMVTDLANELLVDRNWDPKKTHPPFRTTVPEPNRNGRGEGIAPAKEMAYKIPTTCPSRTDDFVDDLINVCIDDEGWLERGGIAPPLAVHVTSRPHEGDNEPVERRPNLSPTKVAAEGTHAEVQVVLGWELDGRALLCTLPIDKYLAWSAETQQVIKEKTIPIPRLESLIGKLVHASFVLPLSRHFLNRLRHKVDTLSRRWGKAQLGSNDIDDLEQFTVFLGKAAQGISLNLLVHRKPTRMGASDSCPVGMGGYSFSGRAWRVRIPKGSLLREGSKANNVLEFLALAVTAWIMCEESTKGGFDCLLSLGDGTSAIGWMYHAGKLHRGSPYFNAVQMIARKLATLVYEHEVCLSGQHIKGELNSVADWLSYEGAERSEGTNPLTEDEPDDATLTERFHSLFPQMIPRDFKVSPLEPAKLSWVVQVLRTLESSLTPDESLQTRKTTGTGDDTTSSSSTWTLINTRSISYSKKRRRSSEKPSLKLCAMASSTQEGNWLAGVRDQWVQQQLAVPQDLWLRRYGAISGEAPFTRKGEPSPLDWAV